MFDRCFVLHQGGLLLLDLFESDQRQAGYLPDGGQRVLSLKLADEIIIRDISLLGFNRPVISIQDLLILEFLRFCF